MKIIFWQFLILFSFLNFSTLKAEENFKERITKEIYSLAPVFLKDYDAELSEKQRQELNLVIKERYPMLNDEQVDFVRKKSLMIANVKEPVAKKFSEIIDEIKNSKSVKDFIDSIKKTSNVMDLIGEDGNLTLIVSSYGLTENENKALGAINFYLKPEFFIPYNEIKVSFENSENFVPSNLLFLTPKVIFGGLGYDDIFPVMFKFSALNASNPIKIAAKVNYKICNSENICMEKVRYLNLDMSNDKIQKTPLYGYLNENYRKTIDFNHNSFKIQQVFLEDSQNLNIVLENNSGIQPIDVFITNLSLNEYSKPSITWFEKYALIKMKVDEAKLLNNTLELLVVKNNHSSYMEILPKIDKVQVKLDTHSTFFKWIVSLALVFVVSMVFLTFSKHKVFLAAVFDLAYGAAGYLLMILIFYAILVYTSFQVVSQLQKIDSLPKDNFKKTVIIAVNNFNVFSAANSVFAFNCGSLLQFLKQNGVDIVYADKKLKENLQKEFGIKKSYFAVIYDQNYNQGTAFSGYVKSADIKAILKNRRD